MVCKEFSSYKPREDKISELVVVGSAQLINKLIFLLFFLLIAVFKITSNPP